MATLNCLKCGAPFRLVGRKMIFDHEFSQHCEKVRKALEDKGQASGDDLDCDEVLKTIQQYRNGLRRRF